MKLEVPVHIDGFECVKDMVNAVLDYSYKGRTLKEWADSISNPITNADRFRVMTDEKLAEFLADLARRMRTCPPSEGKCPGDCVECWLDWLNQEVENV